MNLAASLSGTICRAFVAALLLSVSGCDESRSMPAQADDPVGTLWQWAGTVTPVEKIEVDDPSRYTLLLRADGQAEMLFDCNRGHGSYEISEHRISFGMMISTRMACPEDSQDAIFMRQLDEVTSYFMKDGSLYMEMPMDSGTMRFIAAGSSD